MEAIYAIDNRRIAIARATSTKRKSELGQFMTSTVIAKYMTSMFGSVAGAQIRLLDAGAGIGSLTAAFVERAASEKVLSLYCESWELDSNLHEPLRKTLDACESLMHASSISYADSIEKEDFISAFTDVFFVNNFGDYTHAILNPPYKKIKSDSAHRKELRSIGIETSNLYAGFVALALRSLCKGGELVAITPRSFCNGPYFRRFREFLFQNSALTRIHIFESRTQAFKGDDVLQENVIFHLVKDGIQGDVLITSSTDATFSGMKKCLVSFNEIVAPADTDMVLNLVAEKENGSMIEGRLNYTYTLDELGLAVSTGPVVDFRLKEHLQADMIDDCAPLIYAHHFQNGFIAHPKIGAKKPNAIVINEKTSKWLMPTGNYTVVRRLSSKEEKRRIVPAVFLSSKVPGAVIGFENHLNVFHSGKKGLSQELAKGLVIYLGSSFADQWLRCFSGHTQVNAFDLRSLRYPSISTLVDWGRIIGDKLPDQESIDLIVEGYNGQN